MAHRICNQGTKEAKGVQILGLGTAWKQVFIHFVGRKTGKMSKNCRNLFFGGLMVVDGYLPNHLNDLGSSSQTITPRTKTHHLYEDVCDACRRLTKENISKKTAAKVVYKVNSKVTTTTPTTLVQKSFSFFFWFQETPSLSELPYSRESRPLASVPENEIHIPPRGSWENLPLKCL